jgi:hypothetical protein
VAEFLTPEWVAELDAAARESSALGALDRGAPLTVELRVDDGERGDFVFQATFTDLGTRFAVGSPSEPDLRVTLAAGFADRIRSGDANVQDALQAGALHVRGDLEALVGRAPALAAVGDVFAALRDPGRTSS